MMNLVEQRRAIRHLLDEHNPADAMAGYFAFYHGDNKTTLRPYPLDAPRAQGYVCLSQTGMDLFRPLLTMWLPLADLTTSAAIIHQAITPGTAVIMAVPDQYEPLITALFDVQTVETYLLLSLHHTRFEPLINVLISQDVGANGLPRFVIRDRQRDNILVASAGLNWQTPHFAELSVNTHPEYRRQGYGRSVVAAMANYLLSNGRTPLYLVADNNTASLEVARQVGFADTLHRQLIIQGTSRQMAG
ncbi:MAG TPA: GNAT family N-acetyltransferase [Chloroflexota bacterium]|nr:GNAT family N-acetyltransferase [Chloroflexota bacterium]